MIGDLNSPSGGSRLARFASVALSFFRHGIIRNQAASANTRIEVANSAGFLTKRGGRNAETTWNLP
jgi:hypothetical protein